MSDFGEIDFALDELPGQDLHDALGYCRSRASVAPAKFFGAPAWIIAGHSALAEAFRDAERFPPHRMYEVGIENVVGRTFISMHGDEHLAFRRLATPAFRSRAVATYEREGMAALAHELIDRFEVRGVADLMTDYASRFPYLVISRLLGLPREHEDQFHDWAIAMLRFQEDWVRAMRARRELTSLLAPVVAARRVEPRNDVISELVSAEVDGRRLNDEEVYSHIRLLFPTGGETTHGTLGNLLFALLTHDAAWQRVCSDVSQVAGAVEEVLRWETSIAVLPRMSASRPVDFRGCRLPAESLVLFAIAGANRDPEVFPNPDHFDIDRQCDQALTFGPGLKSCPGMHLARKNLSVAAQVLSERLPNIRLVDRAEAIPRRSVLRCPAALKVCW